MDSPFPASPPPVPGPPQVNPFLPTRPGPVGGPPPVRTPPSPFLRIGRRYLAVHAMHYMEWLEGSGDRLLVVLGTRRPSRLSGSPGDPLTFVLEGEEARSLAAFFDRFATDVAAPAPPPAGPFGKPFVPSGPLPPPMTADHP